MSPRLPRSPSKCRNCGGDRIHLARVDDIKVEYTYRRRLYRFTLSGWRCTRCDHEEAYKGLLGAAGRTLADAYRKDQGLLTGEEIEDYRKRLKVTQTQLAGLIDVHPITIAKWESTGVQSKAMDYVLRAEFARFESLARMDASHVRGT